MCKDSHFLMDLANKFLPLKSTATVAILMNRKNADRMRLQCDGGISEDTSSTQSRETMFYLFKPKTN